jgi:hypothetical protein
MLLLVLYNQTPSTKKAEESMAEEEDDLDDLLLDRPFWERPRPLGKPPQFNDVSHVIAHGHSLTATPPPTEDDDND